MKSQTGARFLYRAKYRQDKSFMGLVLIANPRAVKSVTLASGARKRVKHV
jgi:hypothetical protein